MFFHSSSYAHYSTDGEFVLSEEEEKTHLNFLFHHSETHAHTGTQKNIVIKHNETDCCVVLLFSSLFVTCLRYGVIVRRYKCLVIEHDLQSAMEHSHLPPSEQLQNNF